jgi:Glycosyl transferase family 2
VVVDDASEDGTSKWLGMVSDGRLRLLTLPDRRERSAARNAGLAECRASLVLFLDDDDLLMPDALTRLGRTFERRSAGAAVGAVRIVGEDGSSRRQFVHPRFPWGGPVYRETLFGWSPIAGAVLFRRSVLEEAGGWAPDVSWGEDVDLLLRVSARWPLSFTPRQVLRYRQHPASTRANIQPGDMTDVRGQHVASLPRDERSTAERVLDAGRAFGRAEAAFRRLELGLATSELRRALALAPWVHRSPLLGPQVTALQAKLGAGRAVGPGTLRALRSARHRFRRLSGRDVGGTRDG